MLLARGSTSVGGTSLLTEPSSPASLPPRGEPMAEPMAEPAPSRASPAPPPRRFSSCSAIVDGPEKKEDDERSTRLSGAISIGPLPQICDMRSFSRVERSSTIARAFSSCGLRKGSAISRDELDSASACSLIVSIGGGSDEVPLTSSENSPTLSSEKRMVPVYSPSWKGRNWTGSVAVALASSVSVALMQKKVDGSRFTGSSATSPSPSATAAGSGAAAALPRAAGRLAPPGPCVAPSGAAISSGGLTSVIEILKVAASSNGLVTDIGSTAGW